MQGLRRTATECQRVVPRSGRPPPPPPRGADGGSRTRRPSHALRSPRRGLAQVACAAALDHAAERGSSEQLLHLPCAIVARGKVNLFEQHRAPIIYGGAIDRVEERQGGAVLPGSPVFFSDWKHRVLGWGFFNPTSMYRVRIMEFASVRGLGPDALSSENVAAFIASRIRDAYHARLSMNLPNAQTNVYRLINSEGDSLSGLVVDHMGSRLVVQSTAAWVQRHKRVILSALAETVPTARTIAWKADFRILQKEGVPTEDEDDLEVYAVGNAAAGAPVVEKVPEETSNSNSDSNKVWVTENNLRWRVGASMQKTGFYCDQRDNRRHVMEMAGGKRCLDLCCFTGGFAVSAKAGGASEVVGVDSSAAALEVARANADANGLADAVDFVQDDITKFMAREIREERIRAWDLVVLDPPKLCPSARHLKKALRHYEKINALAIDLVKPGGILVTCSCSGAVDTAAFLAMVRGAAARAGSGSGRHLKVLRVSGASDDHLTSLRYPEGQYLTVVTLMVV